MGGMLHLVQRGGAWAGCAPSIFLIAVPNITAHPSTASVPITVLLYDGQLLCGFNVAIKGLMVIPLLSPICCGNLTTMVITVFPLSRWQTNKQSYNDMRPKTVRCRLAERRNKAPLNKSQWEYTSSSAVVERPRDALCPSVVSFNSVIPRAQSFIVISASD